MIEPISNTINDFNSIYKYKIQSVVYDGLSGNSSEWYVLPTYATHMQIKNIKMAIPGCKHFEFVLNSKDVNTIEVGMYTVLKYIMIDEFVFDDSLNSYAYNSDFPIKNQLYLYVKNNTSFNTQQIQMEILYEDLDKQ